MGQANGFISNKECNNYVGVSEKDALDLLITNALVLDWTGIYKADIGIKGGFIVAIGKAGNPDVVSRLSCISISGSICLSLIQIDGRCSSKDGVWSYH